MCRGGVLSNCLCNEFYQLFNLWFSQCENFVGSFQSENMNASSHFRWMNENEKIWNSTRIRQKG